MISRINKIKETYSEQFKERLAYEKVDISLDSAWDILVSSDLSRNKKNVRWLVETYLNHGYLWEDIAFGPTSKVCETLVEFDKHKRNLEPSQRSLMKYETLGSLWSAIKPYIGQLTPGEEKKAERDKAYAECEVVVDRADGLKIVVPLTEYASKWFGKGTRWCTAGENGNLFHKYAKDNPLFILMMPNGDKLQLWQMPGSGVFQFMDANDERVNREYIKENWSVLREIMTSFRRLECIPEELRDYHICFEAVKQKGVISLNFVPSVHRDYALCLEAVKSYGGSLNYVPYQHKDFNMCMESVKRYGRTIVAVPMELRNYELCYQAVLQYGLSLEHVEDKHKDDALCLAAVKQNGRALEWVPLKLRTYSLCMEAVKQNHVALLAVPDEHKDYDMCLEAVKQNGRSLQIIPEELKDHKMYLEAVKQDENSLSLIPEEMRDRETYLHIIRKKPYTLAFVPSQYKDYEMCFEAVKNDSRSLQWVPDKFKNKEMLEMAEQTLQQETYVITDMSPEALLLKYQSLISDMRASCEQSVTPEQKVR